MLLTSNYRIHVLEAYQTIEALLHQLHNALHADSLLGTWIQELTHHNELLLHHVNPRERAFNSITQLEYLPSQAPKEIIVCAGFLGASETTLKIVQALNKAKDDFKKAILALKTHKIPLQDELLNTQFNQAYPQRDTETAKLLKKSGLARLHLKQCYRKLPILATAPLKIGWTWAHTRSIKKITVAQAYEKLAQKAQKNPEIGIQLQLKKLMGLPEKTPLAIVQELAPHLRANVILEDAQGLSRRLMIKGSMPIFYPAQLQTPVPLFKPVPPKCDKNKNRVRRSDERLDPIPFLPTIRAHQYLTEKL